MAANLTFLSFAKIDDLLPNGAYICQLNPTRFEISTKDGPKLTSPDTSVLNEHIESSKPIYSLKTWDLTFVIDNTGALEFPPMAVMPPIVVPGTSIYPSIKLFRDLFIENEDETHTRSYIKGIWGMGTLTIFGRVKKFDFSYDFFDNQGIPLRATCDVYIEEVPLDSSGFGFMSPDMTRIPQVQDGDTMVKLCEKNYDDKNYYIKVAEANNMSSFRKLKPGKNLIFPPIEK